MIAVYKKFIGNKDTHLFWRKAKQKEYTGVSALSKILNDLTIGFNALEIRNSITLRYIGFISKKDSNKLLVTDAGKSFISSSNKQKILDQQLLKMYLDCSEINPKLKVNVIPLKVILSLLREVNHITFQEYGLFVCWINNDKEVRQAIDFIEYFRGHKGEQKDFIAILQQKIHQLGISNFDDNIKRFYDMLLLASFIKNRRDKTLEAKISNQKIEELINSFDVSNFTRAKYYTYLTARPTIKDSKSYGEVLEQIKKESDKEKERIVDDIYGRKPLPSIEDITPTRISLTIAATPSAKVNSGGKKGPKKIDHELKNAENKRYGDHAEEIVVKYEKKYLEAQKKMALAAKVERVSLKDDTLGYDIVSFDLDGTTKHIEVKGVKGNASKSFRFFISSNEIKIAKKDKNYHLYIVFECGTKTPKVYSMPNPFTNALPGVSIKPIKYMANVEVV